MASIAEPQLQCSSGFVYCTIRIDAAIGGCAVEDCGEELMIRPFRLSTICEYLVWTPRVSFEPAQKFIDTVVLRPPQGSDAQRADT